MDAISLVYMYTVLCTRIELYRHAQFELVVSTDWLLIV